MQTTTSGMTLRQPAVRWQDALPTGNGTLGALVHGHIRHEMVILNHEALWLRRAKPTVPDISAHLPELRRLLAAGQYQQATGFLDAKLREAHYAYQGVDPYHPAFDLLVEMETKAAFTHYRRSVDFSSGEVEVTWREGDTTFRRQLFVSRADDLVVMRISADRPGQIDCRTTLAAHETKSSVRMGVGTDVSGPAVPITFSSTATGTEMTLQARYDDGNAYGGLAHVFPQGGVTATDGEYVTVHGADEVLLVLALYANEASEEALPRLRDTLAATTPEYAALCARHVALHAPLFARMTLNLHDDAGRGQSTDELLMQAYDGDVPAGLLERLFAFGRYLLICSSRPGGLPANLQGVWNGDYAPAWASDYHNDENIQMNYWPALPGHLPETALPYFDYYDASLADYRNNAQAIFGCRGILAPIAQSTSGVMHGGPWLNWTAGAGWLAQLYYDYWLFTGDRTFLATRAVPFMREVALFYEDFLFAGADGTLVFSPSLSPENVPDIPGGSYATLNATMDVAIAKEVLTNLCTAVAELGLAEEHLPRWRAMVAQMPAYTLNEDGAVKEWLHPELRDNYEHRHQSHLYPVFPGFEVTEESHPELFAGMRTAVEKRLVVGLTSQTGWSLAHMANIYARLGDGDRALECLELLTRSCLGANLFTYHNDWRGQGITCHWGGPHNPPPFQIDANFGMTAAMLEMLVFSKPGLLKLLPALPARWPHGSAQGMLCRGGIELALTWDMQTGTLQATLCARHAQEVTVKFPAPVHTLQTTSAAAVAMSPLGPAYRTLTLSAGQSVTLDVNLEALKMTVPME
ncbi:MAG TPA: glycoside hydrolase family 95 protein [Armatimonadota bacterium]|jgi:alpha-L-fucosidase 2